MQLKILQRVIDLAKGRISDRQYDVTIEFTFCMDTEIMWDGKGYLFNASLDNVHLVSMGDNIDAVNRNIGINKLTPEDLYSMIIETYVSKLMET